MLCSLFRFGLLAEGQVSHGQAHLVSQFQSKYSRVELSPWPDELLLFVTPGVGLSGPVNLDSSRWTSSSGPLYIMVLCALPGCVDSAEISLEIERGNW